MASRTLTTFPIIQEALKHLREAESIGTPVNPLGCSLNFLPGKMYEQFTGTVGDEEEEEEEEEEEDEEEANGEEYEKEVKTESLRAPVATKGEGARWALHPVAGALQALQEATPYALSGSFAAGDFDVAIAVLPEGADAGDKKAWKAAGSVAAVDADVLIANGVPASYGDLATNTTVTNPEVRVAIEVFPERVRFGADDATPAFLPPVVQQIAAMLSVQPGDLMLRRHKVNVYSAGGFFKGHVDTPCEGMIGTLVLSLPAGGFKGGAFKVKCHTRDKTLWSRFGLGSGDIPDESGSKELEFKSRYGYYNSDADSDAESEKDEDERENEDMDEGPKRAAKKPAAKKAAAKKAAAGKPKKGKADPGVLVHWIMIYGDCAHEVKKVTEGNRVTVTYDILVAPLAAGGVAGAYGVHSFSDLPSAAGAVESAPETALSAVLSPLLASTKQWGVHLMHSYTWHDLSPEGLKGSDGALYRQLIANNWRVELVSVLYVLDMSKQYDSGESASRNYRFIAFSEEDAIALARSKKRQQPWSDLPILVSGRCGMTDFQTKERSGSEYTGNQSEPAVVSSRYFGAVMVCTSAQEEGEAPAAKRQKTAKAAAKSKAARVANKL